MHVCRGVTGAQWWWGQARGDVGCRGEGAACEWVSGGRGWGLCPWRLGPRWRPGSSEVVELVRRSQTQAVWLWA